MAELVNLNKNNYKKKIEKIMLIFPPSNVHGVGIEDCMVPNGILCIGGFIKNRFPQIEVKIIDGSVHSMDEILQKIKEFHPDLIGLSMLAANCESSEKIAKYAKEAHAITVVGNHHSNYLRHQILEHKIDHLKNIDYIVTGIRGEFSFTELIEALNNEKKDLDKIKSLAGRKNKDDSVFINEQRPKFEYPRLKNLCDPDLSLIDDFEPYFKKYNEVFGKFHEEKYIRQININYIKGCLQGMKKPCIYCCLKDHVFDFLEPEDYWKKIKNLTDKGFNFVFETCNSITSLDKIKKGNGSYLKKLSETMPEELKDKVKMLVYARVDEINQRTIKYLKNMNVLRVIIGFDSGSKTLVDGIGKINTAPEHNLEVARMLDEANIQIYGCYVAGAKGECRETLESTYKQIIEMMDLKNTTVIEYTSLAPMPGSASWNFVKEEYFKRYGSTINVEKLSKLWVDLLREKGEIETTWEEIEYFKQKLKEEAQKKGIVFGGYY